MRLKKKNGSPKYDMNRPRPRHGHEYTKYKMFFNIMILECIKQHLSNVWSSIHEKFTNTEVELKKSVAYKKSVYIIICKKPFDSSFIVSKSV